MSPTNINENSNHSAQVDVDPRTKLPNLKVFYEEMEALFSEEDKTPPLIVLVIDITGLDFILRTFGPNERDVIISEISSRIHSSIEKGSSVYHITQDRFCVVLPHSTYMHSNRVANTIINKVEEPYGISEIPYTINAFIGISHYPNHADTINELVRSAVSACHQAKSAELKISTFDKKKDADDRHKFLLLYDLEKSLDHQSGLELYYQPQIDLETEECIGVEGLIRWTHEVYGKIPPGNFLPYVEQTSLMMPFTEMTLSLGLRDLAVWQRRGYKGTLAINLSPALLGRPDILDTFIEHCKFSNIPMDKVHLEVTENGILDHPNLAANTLSQLMKQGTKIAIDDFGTGHSTLVYLADLPINIIKIDQYFVKNLSQRWGRAIVGATAILGKQLGLKTIAEGIEDEFQLKKCKELGVDIGQGFYLGKPMPKDEFENWLGI